MVARSAWTLQHAFALLTYVKSERDEESNDTKAVPISSSVAKAMITRLGEGRSEIGFKLGS